MALLLAHPVYILIMILSFSHFISFQLFENINDSSDLGLFEISGKETLDKQHSHSMETAKLLEHSLKVTLLNLTEHLFGKGIFVM